MELLIVLKVVHERLKAVFLRAALLEVVEGVEDDLVATADQADRSEQLEHERLGTKTPVVQAQRNTVNGLFVCKHQVEAILKDTRNGSVSLVR